MVNFLENLITKLLIHRHKTLTILYPIPKSKMRSYPHSEKYLERQTRMSSTTLSSSNLSPTATTTTTTSSISEPKSEPEPASPPDPPSRKNEKSPQLNQWSRARAVRSGRKLDRPVQKITSTARSLVRTHSNNSRISWESDSDGESGGISRVDETEVAAGGKSIYMVSDGTGWTAEHSVIAALEQFEHCLIDRVCRVNTHLFSGIDDIKRLMAIIKQAAKEGAMLVYTLADPSMAESAKQACQLWGVPSADILSPITEAIASHLGVSPSGLARWAPGRRSSLSEDYFRRIEAVEFTIKQDDGALPENLHRADIVLVGVSRTGKTPLSIYLSQKGYKVANVPVVMNVKLPSALFQIDPEKIFGLTINAVVLQTIRRTRARTMGFGEEIRSNYFELDYVKEELEFAGKIFAQNPVWPVIEVTRKAVEETAAIILRLFHERKDRCSVPRISRHY